jgi:hypothetical protein
MTPAMVDVMVPAAKMTRISAVKPFCLTRSSATTNMECIKAPIVGF